MTFLYSIKKTLLLYFYNNDVFLFIIFIFQFIFMEKFNKNEEIKFCCVKIIVLAFLNIIRKERGLL